MASEAGAPEVFHRALTGDGQLAVAVAAIQALTSVIENSTAATMMGLEIELSRAVEALRRCSPTSISLSAGCALFMRYVTRHSALDLADLPTSKAWLIERGNLFAATSLKARAKIAELGEPFIRDGSVVMTHGLSRVVMALLKRAAAQGKHFSVVVTEGRPDDTGPQMARLLAEVGVPVTLVLDSAAAFMMERVDIVLVGAEGVAESGGIINKLGTFQVATVAKAFGKAFYVAAESYKFARLFPLTQRDLPAESASVGFGPALPGSVTVENPSRDYTPPHLITMLFTDLGVLTPSAVSDELIQARTLAQLIHSVLAACWKRSCTVLEVKCRTRGGLRAAHSDCLTEGF